MFQLRNALSAGLAFVASVSVSGTASAALYPSLVFPATYGRARLAGWESCFEGHYGQMWNVCGSTQPGWTAAWSTHSLLWAPAVDAYVGDSNVDFKAYVYTTSTSASYKVTCQAIIVDIQGWSLYWTSQSSTTTTGWQNLSVGSLDVNEWYNGVIEECTVGLQAKLGTMSSFASYGS